MSLSNFTFTGSAYEQGLAHGEALQESITKNIEIYLNHFENEAGIGKIELLENTGKYLNVLREQSPEYISGMYGIAESSNIAILEIAMLNFRYELLYHALGKKLQAEAVDGCTSFAVLPEAAENNHLLMGQNWDWIPDVECVLTTSVDPDGMQRMAFTEAGIFGGKPGMNSEGIGLAVNGMYSTNDDWKRFEKPFHLRCYEVLRSKNMEEALHVLAGTPRSCTANFILGHAPNQAVDIELAPDSLRLIDPINGVLAHANHLVDPQETGVEEPGNPRRYLTEFRHKHMEELLNNQKPLNVENMQEILKDHEHKPQSLCRHRDDALPESQHTITKTAMIIDLEERKMWVSDGQPCKAVFEEFVLS
ncbi:MAG: peptidase C45 [Candidatus Marinimicrobia bacterium]|nr:peptidase C45 [Candidatus Neomarinimicrobiota bacterium]